MKRGWKTWMWTLAMLGMAAAAAWADIATPPNDYTGFLYRGGHYATDVAGDAKGLGNDTEEIAPDVFWTAVLCVGICFALPVGIVLVKNSCFRSGVRSWNSIVVAILLEAVLAGFFLFCGKQFRYMLRVLSVPPDEVKTVVARRRDDRWPDLRYHDTPELRAEYDRFCIDWYNAHRGDCTGEHSYIYWRRVPEMRKGAPEAVTNAYEAFRKSLNRENDRLKHADSTSGDKIGSGMQ